MSVYSFAGANHKRGALRGNRLHTACLAAIELLEKRRMLSAVVVPPTAAPTVSGTTPLAPVAGKTFWVNGLSSTNAWQWNSSITPVTTNDLVLNVAPFASLYTACCEGGNTAPGSTSQAGQLLTNGLTQNQIGAFPSSGAVAATGSGNISDSSSGENVLSDLADQPWWFEYNLGGQPGATPSPTGYDISEIDVITGHQDYRTGQNTDIQVQFVAGTDWISLSNNQNFNFTQDQTGARLDRGAAQMAVVNSGGGTIVSNVKAVKFVASNSNTWYRELVVSGAASSSLPSAGPAVPTGMAAVNDPGNVDNVDVSWHNSATGSQNNPFDFQVQRATVVNGSTGSFVTCGTLVGVAAGQDATFIDKGPAAGTYVYRILAFNSFNGGTFSTSAVSTTVSVHVLPAVLSIARTSPPGPITSNSSVSYTVTFNEAVTGVDATDFALSLNGVTATTPVVVSGSGAVYTVTVNGISGNGTLGLNLVDNGTIHDLGRTLTFQSQIFAAGSHPRSVAAADVNGDGKPDLIVANLIGNSVSVLLGNGDGTFQAQRTFAVGAAQTYSLAVAVADVNGDGKQDIVVANDNFSGTVSVLLGNGNGTFQPQQSFAAGQNPYSMVVSDVNGDGKLDVVVANNVLAGSASVLLGNGNGTYQAPQTFATGPNPRSIAVADVNGDGKGDLIVANYGGNSLSLLLGNGNGTFQAQQTLSGGSYPQCVTTSDVNGDAKKDLIVTNYASNTVSVLLGNGNGTFQGRRAFATGAAPFFVTAADVNADGKPDLIVANDTAAGTVSLLLSNGNGTFQSQQTFAAGANPTSLAVSDVNGDGKADVVAANFNDNTVSVLLDNLNLNFTGQLYSIVPSLDTITGASGVDQITLMQNPDGQHIDWTLGSTTAELLMNDPRGLTINGNGSTDVITLQYANGSPIPNTVHLNGTFTINGLSGTNPLANTTLEIGRSTVFISYSASDPIAAIKSYLQNGYNSGGWNGAATASTGVIISIPAASNALQTTAIGYADSADGLIAGQPFNTIELKYTLYGDTTLAATVGSNDFTRLTQHYHQTTGGAWDLGDFNYDGSVNFNDFALLTRAYNTSLGNQAAPAATSGAPPASGAGPTILRRGRGRRRR